MRHSYRFSFNVELKNGAMPRAPRKPLISEAANTPPGCTASSSVEDAHESVDLYLDYNGVLNNGAEFREKLCDFMVKLEHIDVLNQNHSDVVRITLLSYRRHRHGCAFTLQELAEAGVLYSFHNIVFTAERSGDRPGKLEAYTYDPRDVRYNRHDRRSRRCQRREMARSLKLNGTQEREYHWFTSSKDEYIARNHQKESTCIIFADDKLPTLRAVKTRYPYATCIWMQAAVQEVEEEDSETLLRKNSKKAYRDAQMLHAENLEQLCCSIVAALNIIRQNSTAMRTEYACFEYLLNGKPGYISD